MRPIGRFHKLFSAAFFIFPVGSMAEFRKFVRFSKIDDNGDGTVTVHGVMTSEAVDADDEVIDYDASKRAIYKRGGFAEWRNLRSMHQNIAAGTVPDIVCNDDVRNVEIAARVIDENEVRKTRAGVYHGFSVAGLGHSYKPDTVDGKPVTRYTDVDFLEVSLVDRPSNPDAVFTMMKVAPSPQQSVSKISRASGPAILSKGEAMDEEKEAVADAAQGEAQGSAWDSAQITEALNIIGQAVAGELAEGETEQAAQLQAARKMVLAWLSAEAGEVDTAIDQVAAAQDDQSAEEAEETPEEEAAETPEKQAEEEAEAAQEEPPAGDQSAGEGEEEEEDDEDVTMEKVVAAVLASPGLQQLIKSQISATLKTQIQKGGANVAQAFTKLDDVATRMGVLENRVGKIAKRALVSGPVLRENPGADEAAGVDATIAGLNEMLKAETDPALRQSLMQRVSKLQMQKVYAAGGHRLGESGN